MEAELDKNVEQHEKDNPFVAMEIITTDSSEDSDSDMDTSDSDAADVDISTSSQQSLESVARTLGQEEEQ